MSKQARPESPLDNFSRSKSCKKNKAKHINNMKARLKPVAPSELIEKTLENFQNSSEKQQMLEQIKAQDSEISFLQTVLNQFLDINELMKIKQKSVFDSENETWTLPSFLIQQRRTVFPNLQRSQIKELVNNDLKRRKVVVKDQEDFEEVPCESFIPANNRPATSCAAKRNRVKGIQNPYEKLLPKY